MRDLGENISRSSLLELWEKLSEIERLYLRARACDIAQFGADIADKTWPQPTIAGVAAWRVSHLVSLLVDLQTDVVKEIGGKSMLIYKYLFSWDEVPGNDSGRLKDFLKQRYRVDWVKAENIKKSDDGNAIIIASDGNSLSLSLSNEKTKVNLKINDGRSAEFVAESVNGKLNIFTYNFGEINETHDRKPIPMPDNLAPRVLNENEREAVKKACLDELLQSEESKWNALGMLAVIKEIVLFCNLLSKPENHIKKPSGQYVEKEVPLRTEADMVGEMRRELTDLPNFAAYAKVMQVKDGTQSVVKHKINTPIWYELPEKWPGDVAAKIKQEILEQTHQDYCQGREIIEKQIGQKQAVWQKDLSEKPLSGRYR